MTKILIYSHDTYGLGNIRRMLCVARHLVANEPDVSVLLLSESPMLHAFRIPQQIDYVNLPCLSPSKRSAFASGTARRVVSRGAQAGTRDTGRWWCAEEEGAG